MDDPDHIAVVWSWSHRRWAVDLARALFQVACGESSVDQIEIAPPTRDEGADDAPLMIADARRKAVAVAVTGTNGKTTTTRLIAHIARTGRLPNRLELFQWHLRRGRGD